MIILYGIKNCDTVKKARQWLDTQGLAYEFHDLKTSLNAEDLDTWLAALGWELLINKRSTTWRQLPDASKINMDAALAKTTLLAQPTLIKRPVLLYQNQVYVGFKPAQYQAILL